MCHRVDRAWSDVRAKPLCKRALIAQSKAEEIQRLTEEISEIQERNIVLGQEITVEDAGIEEKLLNFEVTVAQVKAGIQTHKDQVDKYLSQGTKEETTTDE